jgi:DnaJ-class molecular chaperone
MKESNPNAIKFTKPGAISRERYVRLQKLNPLLASGAYTLAELANRFGVNPGVIYADREYIYQNWWKSEHREEVAEARLQRIKELEHIRKLALESYHRSRQDKEEVTTRFDKKECDECGGSGKLPKCTCIACEGLGYVMEEVMTRKVQGQPGSCEFLEEARKITIDICKIEALFKDPEVKVQHVVSGDVKHSVELEKRFTDVDPELIIQAKLALARLEQASKEGPFIEGEVLKIETKQKEE